MKRPRIPLLAVAACLVAAQIDSLNAAVSFRGVPGSYAASTEHLGGGANTLSTWTIEFWVRPATTAVSQGLFDIHGNQTETSITIGDGGSIGMYTAGFSVGSAPNVITSDEWQLLGFVGSEQNLTIYRNGLEVASGDIPAEIFIGGEIAGTVSGVFNFGFRDYQTLPDTGYYSGSLSDFRVWNRALTPAELSSHVVSQPATDAPGLVNWIPFDETSGDTFQDVVSGVTGTYYNVDFVPGPFPLSLTDGLVAYYPFDGNANDESGNGHNGVPTAVQPTADRFGEPGKALLFNGLTSSVEVASLADLAYTPATYTLWVKIGALPEFPPGTGHGEGVRLMMLIGRQATMHVHSGSVALGSDIRTVMPEPYTNQFCYDFGGGAMRSHYSPPTNQWLQLAVTVEAPSTEQRTVTWFIDGVQQYSGTWDESPQWDVIPFTIGSAYNQPSPNMFFNGVLDDVRIYSRALSEKEVAELYDLESTPDPCIPHAATVEATVINGFVVGATLTDGGCGYLEAPVVMIRGSGTGATATATITDGVVTDITITSAGSGYGDDTRILVASPPFMPSLEIAVSKVMVTLHVVLGKNYVLESSADLATWTPVGPAFTAEAELLQQEFDVAETGRYFRIQEVP